ncbi:AraC family transcriptional regulator [Nocardia stercoris]|nr:AraC family transcriptional regulator [Nocardia stercoris]
MTLPTDPLLRPVIPPRVLAGLVDLGRRDGAPVASWFAGTGVDPDELTSPEVRVPYRQTATILRRALRSMPGEPVGMRLGRRDFLLSFGMVGLAVRTSASVAEAFEIALELHRASGTLVDAEAEIADGVVVLSLRQRFPDPELTVLVVEEAMCSVVALARSMIGADCAPVSVQLSYPPPPYVAEYHRYFECPIRFAAGADHLVFPVEYLRRPLATHDATIRATAVASCRRLLAESPAPDLVAEVEAVLSLSMATAPTMAAVAEQLHVSERTLRRQLGAAGETFSALRDRVRERYATVLLSNPAITIDAVARRTGFSDAREFRRAYQRWTGRPPSTVRRDSRDLT